MSNARNIKNPDKARRSLFDEETTARIIAISVMFLVAFILFMPGVRAAAPVEAMRMIPVEEQGSNIDSAVEEKKDPGFHSGVLLDQSIDITVAGVFIRGTVRQTFKNPTARWQHALYQFPLPDDAAVDGYVMIVGDRRIVGRVKEKVQAQQLFSEAAREGKKAALLDEHRPNVFSMRLANIPPNGNISVELTFQTLAKIQPGGLEWRLPLTIMPRYTEKGTKEISAVDVLMNGKDAYDPAFGGRFGLSLDFIGLASGTQISSPSHHLLYDHSNEEEALTVRLAEPDRAANRDLVLNWSLAASGAPSTLSGFRETVNGETFLLGVIAAPRQTAPSLDLRREVTFIIDSSGSMAGESIRQAKTALLFALDRLTPADRFNIIEFDSSTYSLFPATQPASSQALAAAKAFVDNIEADGGTEMGAAITEALAADPADGFLSQILFLTDGAIYNEDSLFALISKEAKGRRIFTVGVGSAPNGWLMRKAAEMTRGRYEFIPDLSLVTARMQQLFEDMASPVLIEPTLVGDMIIETLPEPLPDVYAGRSEYWIARLPDGGDTAFGLKAEAMTEKGAVPFHQQFDSIDFPHVSGLSKLWARRRIEQLMEQKVIEGSGQTLDKTMLETSLTYQVLSPLTSFLAVEEKISRPASEKADASLVKKQLPKGAQTQKIFGPAGATPMPLLALLTLLFAGLAAVAGWWALRTRSAT